MCLDGVRGGIILLDNFVYSFVSRVIFAINDKENFIIGIIKLKKGINVAVKSGVNSFAGTNKSGARLIFGRFGWVFAYGVN